MKNYDQSVNINCDPNWPFIRDYPYRILTLIFGPSPPPPPSTLYIGFPLITPKSCECGESCNPEILQHSVRFF